MPPGKGGPVTETHVALHILCHVVCGRGSQEQESWFTDVAGEITSLCDTGEGPTWQLYAILNQCICVFSAVSFFQLFAFDVKSQLR